MESCNANILPTMIDIKTAKKIAEKYKRIYGKKIHGTFLGISPPSIFVSSSYPYLSLGILASDEEIIDDPVVWSLKEEDAYKILESRLKLINFYKILRYDFPRKNTKLFDIVFEGISSTRSVEYLIHPKKVSFLKDIRKLPFGSLYAKIKNISLESNPKIPRIVLDLNESFDIKAEEAVHILYKKGFSDYYIQKLFSLGAFGLPINRKLVPSRWAITAIHSILIKKIESIIKEYKEIEKIVVLKGGHYGNIFYIILLPGKLRYEYFEVFLPGSVYNKYDKPIYGKDEESGGYYASKLSAYEILKSIKRKASVLCIRFVEEKYKIPLGVWVVREGVKKTIENRETYSNIDEMIKDIVFEIERKYRFNMLNIFRRSVILKDILNKKLIDYFKR